MLLLVLPNMQLEKDLANCSASRYALKQNEQMVAVEGEPA
jgi:hypothetical protein